ncbi:hypothetical protein [Phenylobacterium sp.]|uniref:hypothetical protein n=1 Tax=Phenylobacterium sp. TaxID=1871053 RepID=UPI0037845A8B
MSVLAEEKRTNLAPDIVAIIGCARSGSTVLEGKVQQAANVTGLGEVAHLWSRGFLRNELCGCGVNFSRCEFWTEVLARAFGKVQVADARRFDAAFRSAVGGVVHLETPSWRPLHVDPLFGAIARDLYRAAHQIGGERPLVDSSKPAHFAASLKASSVGHVLPLHVFRSPGRNVQSLRTSKPRPQAQEIAYAMMPSSRTLAHAIAHWIFRNAQASNFIRHHDGCSATIFFDGFCQDVDAQLQAIMERLALPARQAGRAETWHSVSGNPVRFQPNGLEIRGSDDVVPLTAFGSAVVRFTTARQQMLLEARSLGTHQVGNEWRRSAKVS